MKPKTIVNARLSFVLLRKIFPVKQNFAVTIYKLFVKMCFLKLLTKILFKEGKVKGKMET
ncbi:hypothetical protein CR513_04250, partial [Mucuna pruriens]